MNRNRLNQVRKVHGILTFFKMKEKTPLWLYDGLDVLPLCYLSIFHFSIDMVLRSLRRCLQRIDQIDIAYLPYHD